MTHKIRSCQSVPFSLLHGIYDKLVGLSKWSVLIGDDKNDTDQITNLKVASVGIISLLYGIFRSCVPLNVSHSTFR